MAAFKRVYRLTNYISGLSDLKKACIIDITEGVNYRWQNRYII